jgi:hypothetical protein
MAGSPRGAVGESVAVDGALVTVGWLVAELQATINENAITIENSFDFIERCDPMLP